MSVMRRAAGSREPAAQRLHVGLAAEKGRQRQGQRGAAQLIDRRVVSTCPRAANERVTRRAGQVESRRQRTHGLDMGPPPLAALQRAHGMDRQARNRRELFLREARGLAQRFELRAKRPGGPGFMDFHLTAGCTGVVRVLCGRCRWSPARSPSTLAA